MNPVIKFTTLFGSSRWSWRYTTANGALVSHVLAAVFAISLVFVWRSFYGMRIGSLTR